MTTFIVVAVIVAIIALAYLGLRKKDAPTAEQPAPQPAPAPTPVEGGDYQPTFPRDSDGPIREETVLEMAPTSFVVDEVAEPVVEAPVVEEAPAPAPKKPRKPRAPRKPKTEA